MTIATEFPDFDLATLPAIPEGWVDASWHNDASPCYEATAHGRLIRIFVDYADAAQREIADGPRFSVQDTAGGESAPRDFGTDDWAEVLAYVAAEPKPDNIGTRIEIAKAFGGIIQEWLTRAQFRAMIDANKAEPANSGICHSHDHCDANMAVLQAAADVLGRPIDVSSDYDMGLMRDAWEIAKAADFFA